MTTATAPTCESPLCDRDGTVTITRPGEDPFHMCPPHADEIVTRLRREVGV